MKISRRLVKNFKTDLNVYSTRRFNVLSEGRGESKKKDSDSGGGVLYVAGGENGLWLDKFVAPAEDRTFILLGNFYE